MLKGELDMRIAICDDEKDALQQTINIVNNVFYEMNIQCYIDQFTNALDLVQCKKQYDVIFLDIELKEHDKNGVWAQSRKILRVLLYLQQTMRSILMTLLKNMRLDTGLNL